MIVKNSDALKRNKSAFPTVRFRTVPQHEAEFITIFDILNQRPKQLSINSFMNSQVDTRTYRHDCF
jgi:hypothetical protein